jgi:LysM repeat protein
MKAKNPFGPILPPGSALGRIAAKHRSHVRVMVFIGVGAGVLGLAVLLIGGCIHARHIDDAVVTGKHQVVFAAATTNTSVPAGLTVLGTNSPAPVPMVPARPSPPPVAPSATPKSAPLIATQAPTAKIYSVVKGDTFSKIAKASGVSVSALVKANPGIEPTKLKVGQVLHIPVAGRKQTLPSPSATHATAKTKQ